MARISKRLIKEIGLISVYDELLREHGHAWWLDNRPEEWDDDAKQLFDVVVEVEQRLKEAILKLFSKDHHQ